MKVTLFDMSESEPFGQKIAERLWLKFIPLGTVFKAMSGDTPSVPGTAEEIAKMDDCLRSALHDFLWRLGMTRDNFLVESPPAWRFIPDSIKVKLKCEERVLAKRVAAKHKISAAEAAELIKNRDRKVTQRYKTLGIENIGLDKNFDIVIDVTTASEECIVDMAVDFISARQRALDQLWSETSTSTFMF